MDIQIIEKQLPVVKTNIEEVKLFLKEELSKYENLVVTEQSLEDDKKTQKQLTKLKKKIDTYRKDLKKELSNPIKYMEEQLKELVAMVESVEKPLKEGIEIFNDEKRKANIDYANKMICDLSAELTLNINDFVVPDNFGNLTITKKAIKEEITKQATELKHKKEQLEKNIELLKSNIEQLNTSFGLEVGITFAEYKNKITPDNFMEISQEIMKDATRRKETQDRMKKAMEENAEREKQEKERLEREKAEREQQVEVEKENKIVEQQNKIVEEEVTTVDEATGEIIEELSITLKFTAAKEKLTDLRKYIDDNEIKYTKIKG